MLRTIIIDDDEIITFLQRNIVKNANWTQIPILFPMLKWH